MSKNQPINSPASVILTALKARYFSIVAKEDYPNTPKVTRELDALEGEIRKFDPKEVEA